MIKADTTPTNKAPLSTGIAILSLKKQVALATQEIKRIGDLLEQLIRTKNAKET